jgi:hypothetical protein
MNMKNIEYIGKTTWTGSYVAYRVVPSFNPKDWKSSPMKCAWCNKDLTRLGDIRMTKHFKKHDSPS